MVPLSVNRNAAMLKNKIKSREITNKTFGQKHTDIFVIFAILVEFGSGDVDEDGAARAGDQTVRGLLDTVWRGDGGKQH